MADEQQMPEKEQKVTDDIQQKQEQQPVKEKSASESAEAEARAKLEDARATGETESVEELKKKLAEAQKQVEEAKDQVLRSVADAQNAKRRADRSIEQAHKFALEKFVRELIPVVDNLERSLDVKVSIDEAFVNALRGGVEMTLSQFIKVLQYGSQCYAKRLHVKRPPGTSCNGHCVKSQGRKRKN